MRHAHDEELDAIACAPVATRVPAHPLCRIAGTDDDVLKPLLTLQVWSRLRAYASSLATGEGGSYDEWGFEYDSDHRDECDEPFVGVRVYVPWGEVVVGKEAFERLIARYYAAIAESMALQRSPVLDEPWWPELTANIAALNKRVTARQAPPEQR